MDTRTNRAVRTQGDTTDRIDVPYEIIYPWMDGVKLLFTVHDEIVSEAPEDMAEEVAEIKAEVMRQAFRRFVHTVPVGKDDKVEVTIADYWSK